MGYVDPKQNINKSLGVINSTIAANQAKFDDVFDDMNKMYAAREAANLALIEQQQEDLAADQANTMAIYNKNMAQSEANLRKQSGAGFTDNLNGLLYDQMDRLWEIAGCHTVECDKERNQIYNLPAKLSEGFGAFSVDSKDWCESQQILNGKPGSASMGYTPTGNAAFLNDACKNGSKNISFSYDKDDKGNYTLTSHLDGGEGESYDMNVSEYVQNRVNGTPLFIKNGDPEAIVKEVFKGFESQLPQDTELIDQTNPEDVRKYNVNHDNRLHEIADNKENWRNTLNNQETMRSVFPQLLQKVTEASEGTGPYAEQAKKLLYGDKGLPGGGDDLKDLYADNNAKMGYWVSNPDWKNRDQLDDIATLGFNLFAPEGTYKGAELTKQVLSPPGTGSTGGSGGGSGDGSGGDEGPGFDALGEYNYYLNTFADFGNKTKEDQEAVLTKFTNSNPTYQGKKIDEFEIKKDGTVQFYTTTSVDPVLTDQQGSPVYPKNPYTGQPDYTKQPIKNPMARGRTEVGDPVDLNSPEVIMTLTLGANPNFSGTSAAARGYSNQVIQAERSWQNYKAQNPDAANLSFSEYIQVMRKLGK